MTDVHVLVRRGPAQTRFTTARAASARTIAHADVRVDARDIEPDPPDAPGRSVALRNVRVLREWSPRAAANGARTSGFHFLAAVRRDAGDRRCRRGGDGADPGSRRRPRRRHRGDDTDPGGDGAHHPQLPRHGRRGCPVRRLYRDRPQHRWTCRDEGHVVPGTYVAGWIKRGPTGVIGTNKHDATNCYRSRSTSAAADAPEPRLGSDVGPSSSTSQEFRWSPGAGLDQLKAAEARLGQTLGRGTVKITDYGELLAAAAGDAQPQQPQQVGAVAGLDAAPPRARRSSSSVRKPCAPGDLLGAADLQALPVLDGAHEVAGRR